MFQKTSQAQSQAQIDEEVRLLIKNAGYSNPTPLQKTVIPTIIQGKDLIIETQDGEGRTAAFVLPLIIQHQGSQPGLKAIVISPTPEGVKKIERQFKLFLSKNRDALSVTPLGYDENAKSEYRALSREPDIIIGTTERIIDHIRRDNVNMDLIQTLVIDAPIAEERGEFDKDLLFISSKLSKRPQIVVFTQDTADTDTFTQILRRPSVINRELWQQGIGHVYYVVRKGQEKVNLLHALLADQEMGHCLILCRNVKCARAVFRHLLERGIDLIDATTDQSEKNRSRELDEYVSGKIPYLITSYRKIPKKIAPIHTIILYDGVTRPDEYMRYMVMLDTQHRDARIVTFFQEENTGLISRLQERAKVKISKEDHPGEEAIIKERISALVKRIREDEDPDELDQYRRLFRKGIPLHLRSYAAAVLMKDTLGASKLSGRKMTTVFVGAGKNRKMHVKELTRIVCDAIGTKPGMLANPKIFDNYSFVDVPAELAEKAIEALNGREYEGRTLNVNYARKREPKNKRSPKNRGKSSSHGSPQDNRSRREPSRSGGR